MATVDVIHAAGGGVIRLGIFALDHCDPHATCRETTGLWVIRIDFSFIYDGVSLRDVIPPYNRPAAHVIASLKNAVSANLPAYRAKWWVYQRLNPTSATRGACCLNNTRLRGKTVVSATYDPIDAKTCVALSDGSFYFWPP
jgi:hypothetical protein